MSPRFCDTHKRLPALPGPRYSPTFTAETIAIVYMKQVEVSGRFSITGIRNIRLVAFSSCSHSLGSSPAHAGWPCANHSANKATPRCLLCLPSHLGSNRPQMQRAEISSPPILPPKNSVPSRSRKRKPMHTIETNSQLMKTKPPGSKRSRDKQRGREEPDRYSQRSKLVSWSVSWLVHYLMN